ncbi:hypothetical protein ABZV34_22730 [Streptomyces sp. NPDC005195]|uniref:hypothetical protein n=1 Tax=Streptomyces sp. NPDC005195 TaxID=3154561 RepID=UPI0033AE7F92
MGRKRGFDEAAVLGVVRDQFWTTGFAGTHRLLNIITGIGSVAEADADGATPERTARSAVALILGHHPAREPVSRCP